MIKRFSGQDLFILSTAIIVLVFIYVVLMMTGSKAITYNESDEFIKMGVANMEASPEINEPYYIYLIESKHTK